jgi:hypothetical protein
VIFINIRKTQLYVIEKKKEKEEEEEDIDAQIKKLEELKGEKVVVKEEPTITTSDFQIITTRDIIPIQNNNQFLPIELVNLF